MPNVTLKYSWGNPIYTLTGGNDGKRDWSLKLFMAVDDQNEDKLTSRVWYWLGSYVGNTGSGDSVDNTEREFKITIDGKIVYNELVAVGTVKKNSYTKIVEGTTTVTHGLDGTWANKAVRVDGYAYSTAVTGTGTTVSVKTLPAPATITLNPSNRIYIKTLGSGNILTVTANRQKTSYQCNLRIEIGDWTKKSPISSGAGHRHPSQGSFIPYWSTFIKSATFDAENCVHTFTQGFVSANDIIKAVEKKRGNTTKSGDLWAKITVKTWDKDDKYLGTRISWVNVEVIKYATSTIKKTGANFEVNFNGTKKSISGYYSENNVPLIDSVLVQVYGWHNHDLPGFLDLNRVTFTKTLDNQFDPGDEIRVDTGTATIYQNGAEEHDLGALGNDYETFVLEEGINQINCVTSSWADDEPTCVMRYREVYL